MYKELYFIVFIVFLYQVKNAIYNQILIVIILLKMNLILLLKFITKNKILIKNFYFL